jgi:hypothetical protein
LRRTTSEELTLISNLFSLIRGMHMGIRWGSQKERDHEEYEDVGGWIILQWILER